MLPAERSEQQESDLWGGVRARPVEVQTGSNSPLRRALSSQSPALPALPGCAPAAPSGPCRLLPAVRQPVANRASARGPLAASEQTRLRGQQGREALGDLVLDALLLRLHVRLLRLGGGGSVGHKQVRHSSRWGTHHLLQLVAPLRLVILRRSINSGNRHRSAARVSPPAGETPPPQPRHVVPPKRCLRVCTRLRRRAQHRHRHGRCAREGWRSALTLWASVAIVPTSPSRCQQWISTSQQAC